MTRATKEQIDALYVAQGLVWGMHPIQVRDLAGDVIGRMTSEEVETATRHAEDRWWAAEAAWVRLFAETARELSVRADRAPAVLTVDNFYALLEQASAEEIRCNPDPTIAQTPCATPAALSGSPVTPSSTPTAASPDGLRRLSASADGSATLSPASPLSSAEPSPPSTATRSDRCDPDPTTAPPAAVGSSPSTTTAPAGGFVSPPTSPAAPAVARTPSGDALLGAAAAAKAAEPGTAAASTTGAADPRGGR